VQPTCCDHLLKAAAARDAESHGAAPTAAWPPVPLPHALAFVPAAQTEARRDWRLVLRYLWNAVFWLGESPGSLPVALCLLRACAFRCLWCLLPLVQITVVLETLPLAALGGWVPPSPPAPSCTLLTQALAPPPDLTAGFVLWYAVPPASGVPDYTGAPGVVMCLFGAVLAAGATLQAGMVRASFTCHNPASHSVFNAACVTQCFLSVLAGCAADGAACTAGS
jgi:hypothetical protein